MMIKRVSATLATGLAMLLLAPVSFATLTSYSQSFEGLGMADPNALGNDGWQSNGLVFDGGGGFKFFYGNFPSPNGGPGFSGIATGEGGLNQGAQYLNVYNDYNCCGPTDGHPTGTDVVHSFVFQEQVIDGILDAGVWSFSFDAKLPGDSQFSCATAPASTCTAFVRTLDPNNDFATVLYVPFDSSTLRDDKWSRQHLNINIDASQAGNVLQFGFFSTASNFDATGVYYDNITWRNKRVIPVPGAIVLLASGLLGLVGLRRK